MGSLGRASPLASCALLTLLSELGLDEGFTPLAATLPTNSLCGRVVGATVFEDEVWLTHVGAKFAAHAQRLAPANNAASVAETARRVGATCVPAHE
eukprot:scaffold108024_cov31-Tisochrysis_lutea.AAC.1